MTSLSARERAISPTGATATSYTGPTGRDRRMDILRGAALLFFAAEVVGQVQQPTTSTFESTATVSAIALIIAAEGALIGMLFRPRVAAGGLGEATLRLWRRARTWYLAAVSLIVVMLIARLVPAIDFAPITALAPPTQTGFSLFPVPPANAIATLVTYPLDPDVVVDVLFLRLGPWPFDVVAVLIVLLLVTPALLRALAAGRWVILLAVSSALYLLELFSSARLLPTRAEVNLPILGWQALFVIGLIAGYYRREVVQWFRHGVGAVAFWVLAVTTLAWLALPLVLAIGADLVVPDVLLAVASSSTGWLFEASAPGPLRLVAALALITVAYGLLTIAWRPLNIAFGWLLATLGSSLLPALVTLVIAAVAINSLAPFGALAVHPGLLTAAVVGLMWLVSLVRSRLATRRGQS
jgi:hypothetical protein